MRSATQASRRTANAGAPQKFFSRLQPPRERVSRDD